VISAYSPTTIDLDIEGAALNNFAAEDRRAEAIASLEKANPKLAVWLTLPVETNGLQDNALSVIESMLRDHVTLAGVNVMTMDFSSPPGAGSSCSRSRPQATTSNRGSSTSASATSRPRRHAWPGRRHAGPRSSQSSPAWPPPVGLQQTSSGPLARHLGKVGKGGGH